MCKRSRAKDLVAARRQLNGKDKIRVVGVGGAGHSMAALESSQRKNYFRPWKSWFFLNMSVHNLDVDEKLCKKVEQSQVWGIFTNFHKYWWLGQLKIQIHEKLGWSCDFKSSWALAGIRVCWSCHLFIIQALDPLWTRIVTANLLRKEFQRLSSIQRSDVREANEARGECGLQKLISCIQLEPSVLHVLSVFVIVWHYLYLYCII